MEGFDVEIAKPDRRQLGTPDVEVNFIETASAIRETASSRRHKVDIVVATYTINDDRKEKVDFAGPYYVAGQDIMVTAGRRLDRRRPTTSPARRCARRGLDVSREHLRELAPQAEVVEYDVYSKCADDLRNGRVEAVTTDNVILARAHERVRGGLRAGRQAVHRGALRHRRQEGTTPSSATSSTTPSRRSTRTASGKRPTSRPSARSHADPQAAAGRPLLSLIRRRPAVDVVLDNLDLYCRHLDHDQPDRCGWWLAFVIGVVDRRVPCQPGPAAAVGGTAYVELVRNSRSPCCSCCSSSACPSSASSLPLFASAVIVLSIYERRSSPRRCGRASTPWPRPGRGGARHRPHVPQTLPLRRAAAGVANGRGPARQRVHRPHQELVVRRTRSRWSS